MKPLIITVHNRIATLDIRGDEDCKSLFYRGKPFLFHQFIEQETLMDYLVNLNSSDKSQLYKLQLNLDNIEKCIEFIEPHL